MFKRVFLRTTRLAVPILAGIALAGAPSALAAITVTHTSAAAGPNNTILLSYRLNQNATSVQVQLSGGQSYAGGVNKGLNTVSLPISAGTQTATITATAPAPNGPGGAEVIVPVTSPDNRATAASTNLIGVDLVKRAGSPYLGNIYLPTGFNQAGQKYVWVYAPDGTYLFNKNLSDIATSGSWPFGVAVAQEDPEDRVVVHNRSAANNSIFTPDLAHIADQAAGFLVPGMSITPGGTTAGQPWNVWQSGSKTKDVLHNNSDLATAAGRTLIGSVALQNMTGGENIHDLAVDISNRFMFKVQVTDGGAGPLSEGGANKWTSADNGSSWTEDTSWRATFLAAVEADLLAAGSTLTTAQLVGSGVSLAHGFNANNPSGSSVWIGVVDASIAGQIWNRVYRVNAASGAIEQTINIQDIPTPEGGIAFADKVVHFLEADHAGNLVITLDPDDSLDGRMARWFAILAPNAASNTTSLSGVSLEIPATATASFSPARVANTGTQQATLTVTVTDLKGIEANNVQATADLTRFGLTATEALTRGAIGGGGITAPYTITFTVPAEIDLANSGVFEVPTTVTSTSEPGGIVARASITVYNAYAPAWTASTTAAVNSSPAANGPTAFVGDDAGNVYSINTDTGQPNPNFAGGGAANVGAPVVGELVHHNGLLYVATTQGVTILNSGTGRVVASRTISDVSAVDVHPQVPNALFVAAGNRILKLNAFTGADITASVDVGAKVNSVAVVPSDVFESTVGALVVAGTEGDGEGVNGKIVIVLADDLTAVFNDEGGTLSVAPYVDAVGPVRSRAVFGDVTGNKYFAIGGASGLWAIDASTGAKLPWVAGSTGGSNLGGNPYTPFARVPANPAIPLAAGAPFREDNRIAFATAGTAGLGGQIFILTQAVGERASYGGYPVSLTEPGSGFADGAGLLAVNGATNRTLYIGSDANDRRFFGLDTKPDDVTYQATAAKVHIFDPNDQATFPGAVAGAFNSAPALAGDTVVVGSAAGRIYGFDSLTPADQLPTSVIAVSPANGADGVTTNPTVRLTFSQDISEFFFDDSMIWLQDDAGNKVSTSISVDFDNVTAIVQPSGSLSNQRTYTVVVSPTVSLPFSSSFYVGTLPVVANDVNGDGVFNLEDVKFILRVAGGLQSATATALQQGDKVAPNGTLTIEDAVALRKLLP